MGTPYFTKTSPLGGEIKRRIEDFQVEEIIENGTVCSIEQLNQNPPPRITMDVPTNPNPIKMDQLHVRMEKFNVETTFAIRMLTRGISTSVKRIGYAGLKDKRGVTCQRISLWKPDVEKLKRFSVRGIAFHHAEWSDKRIDLGDLRGNKFTIVIRNIDLPEEEIREIIQEFGRELVQGIPNYYGEQRFGGFRNVTHVVGKLLLEGKIEEAVITYLGKASEGEEEEIARERKNVFETRDFGRALKEFPDKMHFEKAMLNHLVREPADFAGAFQQLPKKTRYLFTHAYQSHVFNQIIAARVARGLFYPMEGDILEKGIPTALLPGSEAKKAKGIPGEIEEEILKKEGVDARFFTNQKLGELSSWGARKPIVLHVHDFRLEKIEDDAFFEGKKCAKVSFWLDKGAYATTVMRELMKEK
ncbi:MAG: tRNA pseudouridine(13) synthase TruD [Candidatus Diapherotrites archaeon]